MDVCIAEALKAAEMLRGAFDASAQPPVFSQDPI
jgi:hypothetical protein